MKEVIATPDAPAAIGPYSQAIKVNDTIYVSGQLPIDPKLNAFVFGGIEEQTEQCLLNLREILEDGGARLDDVVKVTIYLTDMGNFSKVNQVYARFFPVSEQMHNILPARATVEVSRLPQDAQIEIDCIAVISRDYETPELF